MVLDDSHPSQFDNVFGALPFDITSRIFSHLQDTDCLTCMAVCRSWYSTVPWYSHDVWTDVHVTRQHILGSSPRWEKCLGSHVKNVRLEGFNDESELCRAMQKLIDCGCNQLEYLELGGCSLSSQGTLLPLLNQLATRPLSGLAFTKHFSDLEFIHLLNAHPKVRKFTYLQAVSDDLFNMEVPSPAPLPEFEFTSLTYLYVCLKSSVHQQLGPILQKCPNLEYLSCSDMTNDRFQMHNPSSALRADQLSLWCPKLQFLELNYDIFSGFKRLSFENIDMTTGGKSGLRYFAARQNLTVGSNCIGEYLQRHAHTLEYIGLHGLKRGISECSKFFKSLQCPKLRTLLCRQTEYDDDAMDTMLSHCPALEKLILSGPGQVNINLPKLLDSLPHLKSIEFENVALQYNDSGTTGALTRQFEKLAAYGTKIEYMRFKYVSGITGELLLALPRLPALKQLSIDLSKVGPNNSDETLCQFIIGLGQTTVDTLYLSGLRNLPATVFRALSNLRFLRTLALDGHGVCFEVDASSLAHLLNNNTTLRHVMIEGLGLLGTSDDIPTFLQNEVHGYKVLNSTGIFNRYIIHLRRETH